MNERLGTRLKLIQLEFYNILQEESSQKESISHLGNLTGQIEHVGVEDLEIRGRLHGYSFDRASALAGMNVPQTRPDRSMKIPLKGNYQLGWAPNGYGKTFVFDKLLAPRTLPNNGQRKWFDYFDYAMGTVRGTHDAYPVYPFHALGFILQDEFMNHYALLLFKPTRSINEDGDIQRYSEEMMGAWRELDNDEPAEWAYTSNKEWEKFWITLEEDGTLGFSSMEDSVKHLHLCSEAWNQFNHHLVNYVETPRLSTDEFTRSIKRFEDKLPHMTYPHPDRATGIEPLDGLHGYLCELRNPLALTDGSETSKSTVLHLLNQLMDDLQKDSESMASIHSQLNDKSVLPLAIISKFNRIFFERSIEHGGLNEELLLFVMSYLSQHSEKYDSDTIEFFEIINVLFYFDSFLLSPIDHTESFVRAYHRAKKQPSQGVKVVCSRIGQHITALINGEHHLPQDKLTREIVMLQTDDFRSYNLEMGDREFFNEEGVAVFSSFVRIFRSLYASTNKESGGPIEGYELEMFIRNNLDPRTIYTVAKGPFTSIKSIQENLNSCIGFDESVWSVNVELLDLSEHAQERVKMAFRPASSEFNSVEPNDLSFGMRSELIFQMELCQFITHASRVIPSTEIGSVRHLLILDELEVGRSESWTQHLIFRLRELSKQMEFTSNAHVLIVSHRGIVLEEAGQYGEYTLMHDTGDMEEDEEYDEG